MEEHTGAAGPTGDDAVDAALRRLQGVDERPVHEHPDLVEGVHQALQDRLAADEHTGDALEES